MFRIARITVTALLALAVAAGPAAARDLRSPDARDAAVQTAAPSADLRSPDAADAALPAPARSVDLRSPDARDASGPASPPVAGQPSSDGFAWGYLAAGTFALVLLTGVGVTTTRHRRRVKHPVVAA